MINSTKNNQKEQQQQIPINLNQQRFIRTTTYLPSTPSDLNLYQPNQHFHQPIFIPTNQTYSTQQQQQQQHQQHHPNQQQQQQQQYQHQHQQQYNPNQIYQNTRSPPFYSDQQHTPPYPNSIPFSPFESTYHHHHQQHILPQTNSNIIQSPGSDYYYHPNPPHHQDTSHYSSSPLRRSAHPKSYLHSPFVSPKPHWQNQQSRINQSPISQANNSPRHASLLPKSPYSSSSSPSTQGPKSPSSLPISQQPLVRGSLAQAKLRGHHFTKHDYIPSSALLIDQTKNSSYLNRPALPKPPNHSQFALWVGNIPSDASHEELWKFFAGKVPHNNDKNQFKPTSTNLDQRTLGPGVESIHLIARSNCAFVNYLSHQQLEKAISNCNGKPLRPLDPYCKPLLCRVRKPEDNIKSGVGAQRIGGMHRSWVKRFDQSSNKISTNNHTHNSERHKNRDNSDSINNRTSSTVTSTSNQSQSTTSSFLASHFPRRYFILKSYTDEDLKISVERSIWVSQTHNEPILDQAYRTSPEGVYLIFSTNQSGEFFGYAKMAGPIWKPGRRYSAPTSPTPESGKFLRARSVSISGSGCMRRNLVETTSDRLDGRMITTSLENLFRREESITISSPRALTPVEGEKMILYENRNHFSPSRRSLPILSSHNLFSRSPIQSYSSKQPKLINQFEDESHHHASHPLLIGANINPSMAARSRSNSNTTTGSRHSFHSSPSEDHADLMTGRPFKVEWIRVQSLSFYRTKNLRNPFNGNREVKVSRDGTEVEPSIGQAIIDEIDKEYCRLNSS